MSNKRIPIQTRSIEKRNKIIKLGFELMCNKGYYNTNACDIAKYAGVSTGIIYQYFDDKREIFIEGIKNYSENIIYPMIDIVTEYDINEENLDELLKKLVDKFVETHKLSKQAHEELMAMSHLDEEVGEIFKKNEINISEKIVDYLKSNNYDIENIHEKVHLIVGMVDNYCHEVVYHKHDILKYDSMERELIKTIEFILKK